MTEEKIKELEDCIPKKHKRVDFSKEKGVLYDYLINIKGKYGFDISDNNFNNCCWDGQRHKYLVGRPDNIDERLYLDTPHDDRRRYTRWA